MRCENSEGKNLPKDEVKLKPSRARTYMEIQYEIEN
jgi:hypothetical protein